MKKHWKGVFGCLATITFMMALMNVVAFADDTHDCAVDGHSYSLTQIVTATCTEGGYKVYTCEYCGDTEIRDQTAPAGHKYVSSVTAPTCISGGYTTHTCSVCGDSYIDEYTQTIGHDYKTTTVKPTCTEGGYDLHTCTVCGVSYKDNYTAMTGHSYNNTVTYPTCTEKGYTTHVCSVCGDKVIDTYRDALGHDYKDEIVSPTCTAEGYTTHTCKRCGDSYTDSVTAKVAHQWDAGQITKAATETTTGIRTYTCTVCHTTKTSIIAAYGVSATAVPSVTPQPTESPTATPNATMEPDDTNSLLENKDDILIQDNEEQEAEGKLDITYVIIALAVLLVLFVIVFVYYEVKRQKAMSEIDYDENYEGIEPDAEGADVLEPENEVKDLIRETVMAVQEEKGAFETLLPPQEYIDEESRSDVLENPEEMAPATGVETGAIDPETVDAAMSPAEEAGESLEASRDESDLPADETSLGDEGNAAGIKEPEEAQPTASTTATTPKQPVKKPYSNSRGKRKGKTHRR